jgi:hypothetical protein
MSNMIQFIAELGANPLLGRLPPEEFAALLEAVDADPLQCQALAAGDADALGRMLGARPSMVCALMVPVEEPQRQDEQPDEDDSEGDDAPAHEESSGDPRQTG